MPSFSGTMPSFSDFTMSSFKFTEDQMQPWLVALPVINTHMSRYLLLHFTSLDNAFTLTLGWAMAFYVVWGWLCVLSLLPRPPGGMRWRRRELVWLPFYFMAWGMILITDILVYMRHWAYAAASTLTGVLVGDCVLWMMGVDWDPLTEIPVRMVVAHLYLGMVAPIRAMVSLSFPLWMGVCSVQDTCGACVD